MPIKCVEERVGRVYLWIFSDPFLTKDLSDLIEDFEKNVLNKASQKIYVVSDFTDVHHLPPNIMSAGLKLMKKPHPMSGPIIEVSPNGFINALGHAFAKVAPSGTIIVRKTRDEALEEVNRLLALEV